MFGRRKRESEESFASGEALKWPAYAAASSDRATSSHATDIGGFDPDEHLPQQAELNEAGSDAQSNGTIEAAAPAPDLLASHIAEIRRLLPPERAATAVETLTRQYVRARLAHGLPPTLPQATEIGGRS